MLSRIAENVYWIGRFIERAEDVGRLVSAYHYSATQLGSLEERGGLHDLIAVLGEQDAGSDHAKETSTFREAASWWVTAPDNSSSVVACIRAARESARRAREVLPFEVWEAINDAHTWTDAAMLSEALYEDVAAGIISQTRAVAGAVDEAMPRDESWEVLRLGTMIERATMTLRAILVGAQARERLEPQDPMTLHMWRVTLRATSSLDAYRRTTLAIPGSERVADLLLRSMTCPRSVLYAVREAIPLVPFGSSAMSMLDRLRELARSARGDEHLADAAERLLTCCDEVHQAIVADWRAAWEVVDGGRA
ncbi:MAG: alpha-E domain-containing protein [Acidobacteriaceae bacterium]